MNHILKNPLFYSLSVITTLVASVAVYSNYAKNVVDEAGKRQGYWVITGNMINDPAYNSSDVVEEGKYANDFKTGVWKKYYPSGNIRSEITFINNKPQGLYTLYFDNGVIEEKGNWARTKNTGNFERNYRNGNPHQKFSFSDSGKRNGPQTYYHENGNIALEVNLLNGKESGIMKRYDDKGIIQEEKSFNNGTFIEGSTKSYTKKANEYIPQPAEIEENSDILETPKEVEKEKTNSAHHFKPDGHNVLYDQNNNISQSGIFKGGRLWDGKWFKYNRDGILLRVDIYRGGKFIGHGLMEQN
ncbi:MAG: toxin-antitoxin system YwqK family antitoxin [Flavobacteriales bacterium]